MADKDNSNSLDRSELTAALQSQGIPSDQIEVSLELVCLSSNRSYLNDFT